MKISYISTFYPLRGGIAHFNTLFYKTLTLRGHSVKAITFSRQYPKLLFPGKTQDEQAGETEFYKTGAEVLLDSINPLSWMQVALRVVEQSPDAVLFKYWIPFFAPCYFVISLFVKLFSRAKVIYILDNFIPHEKRFGDGALRWLATRFVDGYIAMSDAVEHDLTRELPEARYKKSSHPVYDIFGEPVEKNIARAQLGIDQNAEVILFFGYIRKYKGLDVLLDAMPEIVKSKPRLKLLVVGEFYGDEQFYREKIGAMNLWPFITLVSDYVPNEHVAGYFCASDAVVLPYRSATQSGIVQIAYHFARPAIVTGVGGLGEVVIDGKTGFVVPPESPAPLAAAVIRFFGDTETGFEANVKAEQKKYTWEAFAEAFEDLNRGLNTRDSHN
ncbi:MAG: glycosyltransferase [Rhizobacter sp.]|nr:glycosyltransferase [Chlorobiales bacterium]